MRKKISLVFICFAFIACLLSGCGSTNKTNASSEDSKNNSPKENEVASDFLPKIVINKDQKNTLIHYTVKNISGKPKKLTFRTGLKVDYIIFDSSGKKVKQYSDDVMSTQVIKKVIFKNNQEITKDFIISDLPDGHYKIEVFLTAIEIEAKAVSDLIIKNP
ncbi:BsuPI-related putative proteinase inhibitor [Neobacillus cucumis]|uniref:BsuPI-related putative proteinase inhibitor n=1 Tax=Neobacillus cucumis TaxID=1740721 RepID=UPI002E22E89A|nr:BsuPI-related putative proteinase inhibitor [Neobacillus cucumis]